MLRLVSSPVASIGRTSALSNPLMMSVVRGLAAKAVRTPEEQSKLNLAKQLKVARTAAKNEAEAAHKAAVRLRKQMMKAKRDARLAAKKEAARIRREEQRGTRNEKKALQHEKDLAKRAQIRDKLKRSRKEPGQPKLAVSAFSFFVKAKLAARGELPVTEAFSKAALQWKSLGAEAKKPYEDLAEQDKARAERQLKAWRKDHPEAPKRPLSGFMRFTAEKRSAVVAQNPTFSLPQVASEVASQWRRLSEGEKNTYNMPARQAMDKWKEEYAAWKERREATSAQEAEKAQAAKKRAKAKRSKQAAM